MLTVMTNIGTIEIEIDSNSGSAVDAYISKGFVLDTGRELTDEECEALTEALAGEIQWHWREGRYI